MRSLIKEKVFSIDHIAVGDPAFITHPGTIYRPDAPTMVNIYHVYSDNLAQVVPLEKITYNLFRLKKLNISESIKMAMAFYL